MSAYPPERRFPTTQWSIVARLKSSDAQEAENAVKEVFTTYRYPLYGYLRTSGLHHEDAEDVLQGFFEKMLRHDALGQADQTRGKLRTFLLTALCRYKLNFQRGEQRRHRRVQGRMRFTSSTLSRVSGMACTTPSVVRRCTVSI
jgi:RNA polymerase sigma-70 factor (ECF subfamily)